MWKPYLLTGQKTSNTALLHEDLKTALLSAQPGVIARALRIPAVFRKRDRQTQTQSEKGMGGLGQSKFMQED